MFTLTRYNNNILFHKGIDHEIKKKLNTIVVKKFGKKIGKWYVYAPNT